jgi:hypothetical protein
MPRSKITSQSKDIISDDGSVLVSLVEGEQTRLEVTLNWLTNLTGYTILSKVVEADNVQDSGTIPATASSTPTVTSLTIIDSTPTDNKFEIVLPSDLIDNWDTYPIPDKPVFGFIDLEVADTGVGTNQQIWKPLRGVVEVRYSPTEVS